MRLQSFGGVTYRYRHDPVPDGRLRNSSGQKLENKL